MLGVAVKVWVVPAALRARTADCPTGPVGPMGPVGPVVPVKPVGPV